MHGDGTTDREIAFCRRLRPGERFSHTSAARIWGMPLPWDDGVVHVTGPLGLDRRRRRGVVGHRRPGIAVHRGLLPVSSPLDTFLELARLIPGDALVAVGDWMVGVPRFARGDDPRPLATPEGLVSWIATTRAWGSVAALEAARLVRRGVESPRETALRLLLVRGGLPEPTCGLEVFDDRGRIGWFDMVWPDARVIVEYDGDQHRTDPAQYDKDITRFDRGTAAGWSIVRVRSSGLWLASREETLSRVRAAFRASRHRH